MKRFNLLLCIFLFTQGISFAQRQDLSSDTSRLFFQKKAPEYQHWLDLKGFGEALKVNKVQFKKNEKGEEDPFEIEFLLLLSATDVDSAVGQWFQLKQDFDTPSDSLEAFLFRTFIHKMEIPEDQGNIQIYVKSQTGDYIPCFYVFIWSQDGQIKSQTKIGTCKAESFDITIASYPLKKSARASTSKIKEKNTRTSDQVFDAILEYINEKMIKDPRYQNELTDRKPYITDLTRTSFKLNFTVADMGKEVLTNQNRIWWEHYFNINTIAMERLEFKFDYYKNADDDNTYTLRCFIDGKFGSGIFKPRTSGYMNMEDDYRDFFETYLNQFKAALTNKLNARP